METIHPVYLRTLKDLEKDEYGLYIHTPGYKKIRNGIDKSHGKINKMTESKRYPKPPAPPPLRKIMEGINYRKEFLKFWKWLKYWFSPREPFNKIVDAYRGSSEFNDAINKLSDGLKFPGHRNPPKPPLSLGEIIKNTECEELASTTPFTKKQFIRGYNLLIPYLSHSTIKHKLNLVAIMCMRKNMDFDEYVRRYAIICQDITKPKNKYLQRLRRRRKKRYSISTPIIKTNR